MALWAYLRAARPLGQANIAPFLLLGVAVGIYATGIVDVGAIALVLLFGIVDQAMLLWSNDVADRDTDTGARTPFSGGSGVLQEGLLSPAQLLRAAKIAGVALLLVTIALALHTGRPAVVAAFVAAVGLAHAYGFPPLRLAYRGGGAIAQGLGLGIVLPWLGAVASGGPFVPPWWMIAPAFLVGLAGHLATSLPDVEADRAAGKRTFAVRRGPRAARLASVAADVSALALAVGLGPAPDDASRALLAGSALLPLALHFAADVATPRGRVVAVVAHGAFQTLFLVAWIAVIVACR